MTGSLPSLHHPSPHDWLPPIPLHHPSPHDWLPPIPLHHPSPHDWALVCTPGMRAHTRARALTSAHIDALAHINTHTRTHSALLQVYKYPGMNGSQSGWQYATVAGVQNGLLSVMYGPHQLEHLSPTNHGVVVRPPPQAAGSGW